MSTTPIPPEGCPCGALWTVRGKHGKPDCPYLATPTSEDGLDKILLELVPEVFSGVIGPYGVRRDYDVNINRRLSIKAALSAYIQRERDEARYDERTRCFDNVGGEDIKVRAWVANRKGQLSGKIHNEFHMGQLTPLPSKEGLE